MANELTVKKDKKARIAEELHSPSVLSGLSPEEVQERIDGGEVNVSAGQATRSVKRIVLAHTFTYFNILNLALAILIAATGQWKNMLFFGVVICNTAIGIFQELKVKQLIDRLSVITASHITAVRDGAKTVIPIEEIVVDDVLLISVGDQIPTDGHLLYSDGLEVNESMLTGESKPVLKSAGDELLSGSFVVAGNGIIKVDKVGSDGYASRLMEKAANKKRASSEMQRMIGNIIKVVSILIIPVGLLLFRSQYIANDNVLSEAIVRTVSGVIGMIPEGLVLLTSVSFIIGVGRLAQKNALVQEMSSIESLARTDILCTDKTGTITTGRLTVRDVIPLTDLDEDAVRTVMGHVNGAFTDTNVTQNALLAAFGKDSSWEVKDTIPFSSGRKYRAVSFRGHGSYVLGAPDILMPDNRKLQEVVEKYGQQGYRVLLLARTDAVRAAERSIGRVQPLAAVTLEDEIKSDASEIFSYFSEAGVAVKVLSGDNPATVSAVAQRAGVEGAENYIDARTLPQNPVALAEAIGKYSVFGRVSPEQKQTFIKAWQSKGHTVAMVGDGVNDVLAIKDADCGIAMAAGSEAAKQTAHIVLLDSDFSSMRNIVSEGKTIISNIERVSALYLTKTIYSVLLSVLFILLHRSYPWTTLQMGLINVCGIGLPSFLLTLEQRKENVTPGGFLEHVLRVCLPSALTMVTTVIIVQILDAIFKWDDAIFATFNVALGGLVALLVVASVCWPLVPYRKFVFTASVAVFAAAVILLPKFYDMHSLWMWWSLLLIPLAVLIMMLIYWFSKFVDFAVIWFYRVILQKEAPAPETVPERPNILAGLVAPEAGGKHSSEKES